MQVVTVHKLLVVAGLAMGIAACKSPLKGRAVDSLPISVEKLIEQELAGLAYPDDSTLTSGMLETTRQESSVLDSLTDRIQELDEIGPAPNDVPGDISLGKDLHGGTQEQSEITLRQAILAAVEHNLNVRTARLQPGITEEDVQQAEAVFDIVLFANVDFTKTDQPQRVPVIGGVPLGTPFQASENARYETGLRKKFDTGAEVTASTDLNRFENLAPGITFTPDPAYTAALRLGVTQPLLRNFGTDVHRSTIRLAEHAHDRAVEQLRLDLLKVVDDTEQAYWDLVQAWQSLVINEWLVEVGIEVRDVLERRQEFDTTPAQFSDAVARVEQRRANVIRARRALRGASDSLKTLANDPSIPVSSEVVLFPADAVFDSPVSYNLRESIMSGIANRPEVKQSATEIDDAEIRRRVADNQRLPQLNASAQLAYFGLDDSSSGAYDALGGGSFLDTIIGLAFEYPLGNRAGEAASRQARLRQSAALINYRRTLQQVILEVKAALRDVIANYELIEATRSFRVAQAENLRTLMIEEETMAGLTPEFLNLKFTRQETLAEARRQEIQAVVNFDKSLSALHRAMGIGLKMKNITVERDEGPRGVSSEAVNHAADN